MRLLPIGIDHLVARHPKRKTRTFRQTPNLPRTDDSNDSQQRSHRKTRASWRRKRYRGLFSRNEVGRVWPSLPLVVVREDLGVALSRIKPLDIYETSFLRLPAIVLAIASSYPSDKRPNHDRSLSYFFKPYETPQFDVLEPVETTADCTSALGAVGIPSEDAGLDPSS